MSYNLIKYRNYTVNSDTPSQEFFFFYALFAKDAQKNEIDPFPVKRCIAVVPKK